MSKKKKQPKLIRLLERKRKKGKHQSLPLHETFITLVEEWHKKNPECNRRDLAEELHIPEQLLGNWIHQNVGEKQWINPNWRCIIILSHLCKCKIVITPNSITVKKKRGKR